MSVAPQIARMQIVPPATGIPTLDFPPAAETTNPTTASIVPKPAIGSASRPTKGTQQKRIAITPRISAAIPKPLVPLCPDRTATPTLMCCAGTYIGGGGARKGAVGEDGAARTTGVAPIGRISDTRMPLAFAFAAADSLDGASKIIVISAPESPSAPETSHRISAPKGLSYVFDHPENSWSTQVGCDRSYAIEALHRSRDITTPALREANAACRCKAAWLWPTDRWQSPSCRANGR